MPQPVNLPWQSEVSPYREETLRLRQQAMSAAPLWEPLYVDTGTQLNLYVPRFAASYVLRNVQQGLWRTTSEVPLAVSQLPPSILAGKDGRVYPVYSRPGQQAERSEVLRRFYDNLASQRFHADARRRELMAQHSASFLNYTPKPFEFVATAFNMQGYNSTVGRTNVGPYPNPGLYYVRVPEVVWDGSRYVTQWNWVFQQAAYNQAVSQYEAAVRAAEHAYQIALQQEYEYHYQQQLAEHDATQLENRQRLLAEWAEVQLSTRKRIHGATTFSLNYVPRFEPKDHRPDRRRQRDKKTTRRRGYAKMLSYINKTYGKADEVGDFVTAVFDSLEGTTLDGRYVPGTKRKVVDGEWVYTPTSYKDAVRLYEAGFLDLNWEQLTILLAFNEVEDAFYGQLGRASSRFANQRNDLFGPQTGKAFDPLDPQENYYKTRFRRERELLRRYYGIKTEEPD